MYFIIFPHFPGQMVPSISLSFLSACESLFYLSAVPGELLLQQEGCRTCSEKDFPADDVLKETLDKGEAEKM